MPLFAAPVDLVAVDRLAQIAGKDPQRATGSARQFNTAEIENLRARYLNLYEREQHVRDAGEMAGLAEQLGRGFEARVFLTLAVSQEPEREDLRRQLGRVARTRVSAIAKRGQTLADILGPELGAN